MKHANCVTCAKQIPEKSRQRKYCSPTCRADDRRVQKRKERGTTPVCVMCGGALGIRRRLTCSDACGYAFHKQQKVQRYRNERSRCIWCMKVNKRAPDSLYCSDVCEREHTNLTQAGNGRLKEFGLDGSVEVKGESKMNTLDLTQHGALVLWRRSKSYKEPDQKQYTHVYEIEMRLIDGRVIKDIIEFDQVYAKEADIERICSLRLSNIHSGTPEQVANRILDLEP